MYDSTEPVPTIEMLEAWITLDEIHNLQLQLKQGYIHAVQAGAEAKWIEHEQILLHWYVLGISSYRCYFTGARLTPENRSIGYLTPLAEGGSHTAENIVPVALVHPEAGAGHE